MSFNKSKFVTTQAAHNSIIVRVLLDSHFYRMCHLGVKPHSTTLILMKDFFKFQRSEEKDGEVSSNDIKTGDCLINTIEQVLFFSF